MEKQENGENLLLMNEETLSYFLKGLRLAINASGLTDAAFAEGVTSSVNLSNILRGKTGTSERMREALARKAGKDVAEMVLMGKTAESDVKRHEQQEAHRAVIPIAPSHHVDVDNFLAASWALAAQYRKADKDQKWWKEIFDMLPSPTLIVENDIVIHQNKPSDIWGKLVGKSIHDVHLDDGENGDDCPLKVAIETKQESSLCKYIRDDYYKVVASPFRYDGRDIFIVTCTEVNETVGGFRRDRRADVRREEDKNI